METKWLPTFSDKASVKFLLFCFPYCGGSSLAFLGWNRQFPPEIGVYPIVYPGREGHAGKACLTDFSVFIEELAQEIYPYLNKPFAFFGHSLGALVAFELARALQGRGKRVSSLFVFAHRPPKTSLLKPPLHNLAEEQFIKRIMDYGGTQEVLFTNAELKKVYMPILRSDFALWENYTYTPRPLLECPLYVFGGQDDHQVAQDNLSLWQTETTNACCVTLFKSGHFFQKQALTEVTAAILNRLQKYIY